MTLSQRCATFRSMEWVIILGIGFLAFVGFASTGARQLFLLLAWGLLAAGLVWTLLEPIVKWLLS
jgi:xanthine/uracil permease